MDKVRPVKKSLPFMGRSFVLLAEFQAVEPFHGGLDLIGGHALQVQIVEFLSLYPSFQHLIDNTQLL